MPISSVPLCPVCHAPPAGVELVWADPPPRPVSRPCTRFRLNCWCGHCRRHYTADDPRAERVLVHPDQPTPYPPTRVPTPR